jgi:hypothetical protein
MSTLLYALNRGEVPADEGLVRSTVTVVDKDATASVEAAPPDFNGAETDPSTDGGLTTRQLASHVEASQRYVPHTGNSNTDLNAPVNNQVSSSGTAAAREMLGEWGHGTMQVVEGIEPVIRDGGNYGDHYFAVHERLAAGSGNYMSPTQASDTVTTAAVQATGEGNSRAAAAVSQYAAMYAGLQRGVL